MAPNIRELSLRRMNLSNRAFTCIAAEIKDLRKIDISYCPNIHVSGFKVLMDNNKYLSHIQASNSSDAVNNEIVQRIANLEHDLQFLDISFATNVTDDGMAHFKGKHHPIEKLFVNGMTGITAQGLNDLIATCTHTLKIFEASLMN